MIGQRVIVRDEPGILRYIGQTQFAPGTWYGVELDRATGKNDGSVNGVKYFECTRKGTHGVFVRQALIKFDNAMVSTASKPLTGSLSQRSDSKESSISIARSSSGSSPGPDSNDPSSSTLHKIIEKLQSKLQSTTNDIKKYKEAMKQEKSRTTELEEQLEIITVDKDYLLGSNQDLVTKLNDLQLKFDELKTDYQIILEETELNKQIENEIKSHFDDSESNKDVQLILLRNRQLEMALLNLQKLSEQSELTLKREIEKLNQQVTERKSIESDYENISTKLSLAEETIQSLQIQLDSALSLEKIIEHLNLENERLVEQVTHLQKSVDELTELHELDKSLEENQTLVENDLRKDLKNLLEVIRKDQILIKELEKKNSYLSSKLKNSNTGILEEAGNTMKSDIEKEIEAYQMQIKNLKTSNYSDSITSRIVESKLDLMRARLNWLGSDDDHPMRTQLEILFMIKSNIASCYILKEISKSFDKSMIEVTPNFKIQLSYFNEILSTFLEGLLRIWEYNYGSIADIILSILEKLNTSMLSLISSFQNLETNVKFDFIITFITSMVESTLYNFNSELEFGNISLLNFLVTIVKESSGVSYDVINRIRQFLEDSDNDGASKQTYLELAQKFVTINSRASNLLHDLKSVEGDIKVSDVNFVVNSALTLITGTVANAACFLEELESGSSPDDTQLIEQISEAQRVIFNILGLKFEKVQITTGSSIYEAFKFSKNLKTATDSSLEELQQLKIKYTEVTQSLIQKDQLLDDFQLNVQLLEGNMRSLNQIHSEQLVQIKQELKETRQDLQNSKKKVEELMIKNLDLESEIQRLVKSNKIFVNGDLLGAFDNLQSEQQAGDKLAMIEEIVLLRRMVQSTFDRQLVHENYLWLEKPLVENINQRTDSEFIQTAKKLRNLALDTRPIKVSVSNEWVPRVHKQRYIALRLWEQALNYSNDRRRVLN